MITHKDGSRPDVKEIFVFGSNLAGRHGAGAARFAMSVLGAEHGVGIGRTGRCYAIPTKDEFIITLPLETIKFHVDEFNEYVRKNPHEMFFLTRVGCVLAGYKDSDIAPMFEYFENVSYPEDWVPYIKKSS